MASKYETTKKCPALCFEGYTYRFDKLVSANTKKRWRCRTRDCNGCVYSANIQENTDIQTRIPHREHCIPDPDARYIEIVVSDLKVKARTQLTPYQRSTEMLQRCFQLLLQLHHDSPCLVKLTPLYIERD